MRLADRRSTAVVLIEFQNIWTRPGLYNALIGGELRKRGSVANAERLTRAARKAGVAVVHAPLVVDPKNKRGAFAHLTLGLAFRKGTPAAEIEQRVYEPTDLVVTGRTAFDAFVGSDMEAVLRTAGFQTLLFGGFATDQCVGKTMVTANRKGFDSWMVTDSCATFGPAFHRGAENRFAGRVIDTNEAVSALEALEARREPALARA